MINLQALEEKLNLALDNETQESLTEWLLQKRLNNVINSMGRGCLLPLNDISFNVEKINAHEFTIESHLVEFDGWLWAS